MKPTRFLLGLAAVLLSLSALAACSESTDEATVSDLSDSAGDADADADASGSASSSASASASAPSDDEAMTDGDMTDGDMALEQPQRIVSLSPTATEMLFAIGAGEQVVAVDQYSNYPPEAPVTDLDGFTPNLEAILAYEPDLVVISNDANDLVAGLEAVDVPVLISAAPADIEGGYGVIAELGAAVGRVDETAELVSTMRAEMEAAFAAAPDAAGLRVYHELDDTYFSASSNGFIGAVYAEMGVENIADEADTDGFGFPQLTEEYIVAADPQLIVITDQVTYGPDDVAARDGWGEVSAVQNGNVVVVDADVSSRWGPRLPQFVGLVADALNEVSVDA